VAEVALAAQTHVAGDSPGLRRRRVRRVRQRRALARARVAELPDRCPTHPRRVELPLQDRFGARVEAAESPLDPCAEIVSVEEAAAAQDGLQVAQVARGPCRVSQEAEVPMAEAPPYVLARVVEAARLPSDAEVQMPHWVPSHWNDGGDCVCRFWANPLTCQVGCTLPIRTRPEKPCGVDWSKNHQCRLGDVGANWASRGPLNRPCGLRVET
jgi:hypothetical protein